MCSFCGKMFQGTCFNCDINERNKCLICKEKFKICEICKNKFICGFECYEKYKKNIDSNNSNEHLCQMYFCERHFNEYESNLKK